MPRKIGTGTWLIALAIALPVGPGDLSAQQAPNFGSVSLNQPHLIQYLHDGRHDAFQTADSAGIYYPAGVYIRGIGRCRSLKTTDLPYSELAVVGNAEQMIEFFGLGAGIGDIVDNVLRTGRRVSFHSQGLADIDAVIGNYGCEDARTRRIVSAAETIIVGRIEQKKADQIRRWEEIQQMQNYEARQREMQALHDQQLNEGMILLRAAFAAADADCRQSQQNLSQCLGVARRQYRNDLHILETGLTFSPAHKYLMMITEGFGRQAGESKACELEPANAGRADIAELAGEFYANRASEFLDVFDAQSDVAYQAKLVVFDRNDMDGCDEEILARARPTSPEQIQQQLDEWRMLNHGLPNHQAH